MGYLQYQAIRPIHFGQIRRSLQVGEVIGFDGRTTHIAGQAHVIPTMDTIIKKGWLVPVEGPKNALAPITEIPLIEPHPTVSDPQAKQIPYATPETRAAAGKRSTAVQQHVWITGDWLNNMDGSRTCKVCGVTQRTDITRADRQRGDGSQQFHYTDAHMNTFMSLEELSCPTYLGDPGSAAAYAKDQVRKVRGRVDDVEEHLETMGVRLSKIESDNEFLRQRILQQPVIDATMLAEAILIIASKGRIDNHPALDEQIQALLPAPIPDLDELWPVAEAIVVPTTTTQE